MGNSLVEKLKAPSKFSNGVHDLDYEDTKDDFSLHGFVTAEILKKENVDDRIIEAMREINSDSGW